MLLAARDILFMNDPCVELTLSQYFDKADEEQKSFIKDFERRFDPYGAIFQKNISNSQTERKYVLRRMIGEETKIATQTKTHG